MASILARLSLEIRDRVIARSIRAIEDLLGRHDARITELENAPAPVASSTAPTGTGLVRVTGGAYDARAELSGDVTT